MTIIGQIEKKTQARVVAQFQNRLGHFQPGNQVDRSHSNIDLERLTAWLKQQGVSDTPISRALHELHLLKQVGQRSLSLATKVASDRQNDVNQIVTRQQVVGVPLDQEHQRHHYQGHMMMSSLPTADLVVGYPATVLCIFEGALNEMLRPMHRSQMPQGRVGLRIRQAALQFRAVEFPPHQKMPATINGCITC